MQQAAAWYHHFIKARDCLRFVGAVTRMDNPLLCTRKYAIYIISGFPIYNIYPY